MASGEVGWGSPLPPIYSSSLSRRRPRGRADWSGGVETGHSGGIIQEENNIKGDKKYKNVIFFGEGLRLMRGEDPSPRRRGG